MAKAKMRENTGNLFWKGVAIAFIVVFCIIVVFGIIRFYHFEPPRAAANPSQIDLAEKVVAQDLSSRGKNISNYKIQVSGMARGFARDGVSKSIIQVSLYDKSRRHLYLIDADSGQMVMHSETTFYGWMENQTPPEIPGHGPRLGPFWGK